MNKAMFFILIASATCNTIFTSNLYNEQNHRPSRQIVDLSAEALTVSATRLPTNYFNPYAHLGNPQQLFVDDQEPVTPEQLATIIFNNPTKLKNLNQEIAKATRGLILPGTTLASLTAFLKKAQQSKPWFFDRILRENFSQNYSPLPQEYVSHYPTPPTPSSHVGSEIYKRIHSSPTTSASSFNTPPAHFLNSPSITVGGHQVAPLSFWTDNAHQLNQAPLYLARKIFSDNQDEEKKAFFKIIQKISNLNRPNKWTFPKGLQFLKNLQLTDPALYHQIYNQFFPTS